MMSKKIKAVSAIMIVEPVLTVGAASVLGQHMPVFSLQIWHGFNIALLKSAIALVGGVGMAFTQRGNAARQRDSAGTNSATTSGLIVAFGEGCRTALMSQAITRLERFGGISPRNPCTPRGPA